MFEWLRICTIYRSSPMGWSHFPSWHFKSYLWSWKCLLISALFDIFFTFCITLIFYHRLIICWHSMLYIYALQVTVFYIPDWYVAQPYDDTDTYWLIMCIFSMFSWILNFCCNLIRCHPSAMSTLFRLKYVMYILHILCIHWSFHDP